MPDAVEQNLVDSVERERERFVQRQDVLIQGGTEQWGIVRIHAQRDAVRV